MKVMIVDDSAEVRRMITSFIGDLVSELVECGDGCEALATYAEHRPDLVLMDYGMKKMNGFDATKEIKRQFPAARVVIVSQWDSPSLREAAREAGADAYVNKKSLLPLRDFIRYGPALFRKPPEGK
jgi:CheY-like chemotaxis protein